MQQNRLHSSWGEKYSHSAKKSALQGLCHPSSQANYQRWVGLHCPTVRFDVQLLPWVGFPGGSDGKNRLKCRRPGFIPWVRKIPWRREWLTTPVFLPGKFYGQRTLSGYSPCGHKESDTTEQLSLHISPLSIRSHFSFYYFPNRQETTGYVYISISIL